MNIKIELNDNDRLAKLNENNQLEPLQDLLNRLTENVTSETERKRITDVCEALHDGNLEREAKAYKKDGTLKPLTKAECKRLHTVLAERERKQLLNDLKQNKPGNYVVVDNGKTLSHLLSQLNKQTVIPLDVETTGTDIWKDHIVGYVLSDVEENVHYYIPTKHRTDTLQAKHDVVTRLIKPILEKEDVLYVGHNIKFDLHMLMNEGINVTGKLWDTLEVMKMMNENEPSFALKDLVTKYLGNESHTYGKLFGNVGFDEVDDLTLAGAYACKDGDVTHQLFLYQKKVLEDRLPTIYRYVTEVEMPLIHVVIAMERRGFTIDIDYAEVYGKELLNEQAEIKERIDAVLGEINLDSPKQVKEAIEKHTGRQLENTNAKTTLNPMSSEFPIIKDILQYKKITKLYGTYVETLPDHIIEQTGKLMPTFNQNGAKTGRFSSGGGSVNVQNQSGNSKSLFIADEGRVFVGGDFS